MGCGAGPRIWPSCFLLWRGGIPTWCFWTGVERYGNVGEVNEVDGFVYSYRIGWNRMEERWGINFEEKAIIRSLSSRVSSIALEANGKEFNNFYLSWVYCFQKNDYSILINSCFPSTFRRQKETTGVEIGVGN